VRKTHQCRRATLHLDYLILVLTAFFVLRLREGMMILSATPAPVGPGPMADSANSADLRARRLHARRGTRRVVWNLDKIKALLRNGATK